MDPFIAQIVMFGGNFAPRGWAFCDGQLLAISSNTALFSLIGTTFGGDGRTTFGLPDLRGRVAVHPGHGPGLSDYRWGQKGGVEQVSLNVNEIPAHHHTVFIGATEEEPNTQDVNGGLMTTKEDNFYYSGSPEPGVSLGGVSVGNTGGNLPHENRAPYLGVYHIIALFGTFPSRS